MSKFSPTVLDLITEFRLDRLELHELGEKLLDLDTDEHGLQGVAEDTYEELERAWVEQENLTYTEDGYVNSNGEHVEYEFAGTPACHRDQAETYAAKALSALAEREAYLPAKGRLKLIVGGKS